MDGADRRRLGQAQQIAVAAEIARVVAETLAAEIRLAELVGLEHRPHRSVQDEDPVAKDAGQGGQARSAIEGRAVASVGGGQGDGGGHGVVR
jgi:hypothetical protein